LSFDHSTQQMELEWVFNPSSDLGLEKKELLLQAPFPHLSNLAYKLGLEVADGQVRAWVQDPLIWGVTKDSDSPWCDLVSAAGIGIDVLGLVTGDQPHSLFEEGEEITFAPSRVDAPVSQVRLWDRSGDLRPLLGVCLPNVNRVMMRPVRPSSFSGLIAWPLIGHEETLELGIGAGQEAGSLLFPLSVDRGKDGRFFVLDAGNARVQVFDAEGNYLTEWGGKGSEDGMFDFGSGWVTEDFAGNLCVDDDGYIYVADVRNQRIQKFAP